MPFFGGIGRWTRLELAECRPYPSGIVLLNYRVRAGSA
ncbi:riboflavin biosynthesis protein RibD [Arthrobacter nitrophenolicus]|uniref:Riboflavin biosynthesis protein RibD n=1 Tax=Arthrobacter nitrophenolicus TaxID=683150 RepID=L8TJ86_9MICC|nr:riboflavin biosynthesis protein RibD [Arthrobacter nitrophenolicus]